MSDPNPGVSDGLPEGSGDGGSGLSKLAELSASSIATLVAIASDPEKWLSTIINKWVVGGTIDAVAYVLGWIAFAAERTSSIILDVAGPMASPFGMIEDGVVGLIEAIFGLVIGVANSAGLVGPPAAAFAVVVVSIALAVVVFAVWRVFPATEAIGGGLEAIRP